MTGRLPITIDGQPHSVAPGTSVAIALLAAGHFRFRTSVEGERRGPVCGMGICFECRVTIDGRRHQRACLVACAAGMAISTQEPADG